MAPKPQNCWPILPLVSLAVLLGCSGGESRPMRIGVAFETLQTEYWVASFEAVRAELDRRGIEMIEAVADNDANRQLEQIHTLIARGVDGIIVAPKDATTVIPMIRAANEAGVPIVIYNRPPAKNPFQSTTVVADNYKLAKATVTYMAEQAKRAGKRSKAMILIGDLGDINAIGRRDGFEDAVKEYPDVIEVVARVPTEWSQDKALDGVRNALYAHPEIDFVFTSSDFLFPSLVAALRDAGKYHKVGEEGHVLLGGFDGDSTAYRMLRDGYLDACGVQDVYYECAASIDAVLRMRRGEQVEAIIPDPGFVIHRDNLKEMAPKMWGAAVVDGEAD
ncbi:MAG: sugar ABC transporter substrate-binding protein [Planctomycetota bacterium]